MLFWKHRFGVTCVINYEMFKCRIYLSVRHQLEIHRKIQVLVQRYDYRWRKFCHVYDIIQVPDIASSNTGVDDMAEVVVKTSLPPTQLIIKNASNTWKYQDQKRCVLLQCSSEANNAVQNIRHLAFDEHLVPKPWALEFGGVCKGSSFYEGQSSTGRLEFRFPKSSTVSGCTQVRLEFEALLKCLPDIIVQAGLTVVLCVHKGFVRNTLVDTLFCCSIRTSLSLEPEFSSTSTSMLLGMKVLLQKFWWIFLRMAKQGRCGGHFINTSFKTHTVLAWEWWYMPCSALWTRDPLCGVTEVRFQPKVVKFSFKET